MVVVGGDVGSWWLLVVMLVVVVVGVLVVMLVVGVLVVMLGVGGCWRLLVVMLVMLVAVGGCWRLLVVMLVMFVVVVVVGGGWWCWLLVVASLLSTFAGCGGRGELEARRGEHPCLVQGRAARQAHVWRVRARVSRNRFRQDLRQPCEGLLCARRRHRAAAQPEEGAGLHQVDLRGDEKIAGMGSSRHTEEYQHCLQRQKA